MLTLPSVTLVGIDCHRPNLTVDALRYSMRLVKFADVVMVTDLEKFHRYSNAASIGIRTIHKKQSDRKEFVHDRNLPLDYEWDVLTLGPELFNTEHCLFHEWDASVLNPKAWSQEFLEYDYIGAPWPFPFIEKGWPPCEEHNCVGNGGFSLKSMKWCVAIKNEAIRRRNDKAVKSSDRWQCRTAKPHIESLGLRYAPADLAGLFSCEDRIYTGQFGYHGKGTEAMNGWKIPRS